MPSYRILVGTASYTFLPLHPSIPVPSTHIFTLEWTPNDDPASTGRLQQTACFDTAGENPAWISLHPSDPSLLLVCNETMPSSGREGQIRLIRLDVSGTPNDVLCSVDSGAAAPCYSSWSLDGQTALVANYQPGVLSSFHFSRTPSSLSRTTKIAYADATNAIPSRQAEAHSHCIAPYPADPQLVFAADLGADCIRILKLDSSNSELTELAKYDAPAGSGPRQLAWSADNTVLYCMYELCHTVAAWAVSRNPKTREISLTHRASVDVAPPDVHGCIEGQYTALSGSAIKISLDGRFLYASMRNDAKHPHGDCITIVNIEDPLCMAVVQHARSPDPGWHIRDLALSPDNKYLVAGSVAENAEVVMFERDASTGHLQFIDRLSLKDNQGRLASPTCFVWLEL